MITMRFLGRLVALAAATAVALLVERWVVSARTLPLVVLVTLAVAFLLVRSARDTWRDDRADYRMFRNFRMPDDARRVRWGVGRGGAGKGGDQ